MAEASDKKKGRAMGTRPEVQSQNLSTLAAQVTASHTHLNVVNLNDHSVTLAVNEGRFPWHSHPNSDEFFLVVEGKLVVEFEDGRRETLGPMDTLVVKAGVVHQTHAHGRTVNLLFERAGTETEFVAGAP